MPKPDQKKSYHGNAGNRPHPQGLSNGVAFPYRFVPRQDIEKKAPVQFHDQLLENHYDIAFEVVWSALTPIAANPCSDSSVADCSPANNDGDYAGYNKRFLMIDNRLCLSPFTIKSAIANGFANIAGGCYRVITKEEGHKNIEKGNYPYGGGYKRYRAAMDQSKAGILTAITVNSDRSRDVTVQPVIEYYYDDPNPPGGAQFQQGKTYRVNSFTDRSKHKHFIRDFNGSEEVMYHGPYTFGMNLSLQPGQHGKKHHHRFYKTEGGPIQGRIPAENFIPLDQLKEIVYTGKFKKMDGRDPRQCEGEPWYDDLSALQAGDFIFYEVFDGRVAHIGKNFQFKPLFFHEDAVPDRLRLCTSMNRLCPRCALFGMTDTATDGSDAVGLKGRFKASVLANAVVLTEHEENCQIPYQKKPKDPVEMIDIPMKVWKDAGGRVIARQMLMPIMGPPKPNKRDVGGYFDKKTGQIKGAKEYIHASRQSKTLEDFKGYLSTSIDRGQQGDEHSTHRLRNYAQVCDSGLEFEGSLGAENCSVEEIAALLSLLEGTRLQHGFKIGLGKAFGLGSMQSRIKTVWVRNRQTWQWEKIDGADPGVLENHIKGVQEAVNNINKIANTITDMASKQPFYPNPTVNRRYWQTAQQSGLK